MQHALNWFEIPSTDFDRAVGFYTTLLGIELKVMEMNGRRLGMFPVDEQGVGGCVSNDSRKPSADGSIVYLNARDQLDAMLARVETAGGTVILPRTDIAPNGFIAIVQDTEGNHVGLHSMV